MPPGSGVRSADAGLGHVVRVCPVGPLEQQQDHPAEGHEERAQQVGAHPGPHQSGSSVGSTRTDPLSDEASMTRGDDGSVATPISVEPLSDSTSTS